jgi:copper(I)-binding protein
VEGLVEVSARNAHGENGVTRFFLALCLLLPLASCGQPAQVEIKDAWTRDTVGGTANAAVFMTIMSPTADRLVGASAQVANKTDLMTMAGGNNPMRMRYVDAIDLPAGERVSLNSTGLHVWLADLEQPLKAGTSFPLTLVFENAGKREVSIAVIAPAAMPPMPGMNM